MQSRNWLPDAIGASALLAGLGLLAGVAAAGDAMGNSVIALIGGSLALGVVGCIRKEAAAARDEKRRAALHATPQVSPALVPAGVVVMPPVADATASEFDESVRASFAPVVSLTEAQVERQRARQKPERQSTLNRA